MTFPVIQAAPEIAQGCGAVDQPWHPRGQRFVLAQRHENKNARAEAKALASRQVERAGIEGQRKVADANLGPVRYLATPIGAGDQKS